MKWYILILFFISVPPILIGQKVNSNLKNNFGIGGGVKWGDFNFKLDSLRFVGIGVGFRAAYYPIDRKIIGVGIGFQPSYIKTYGYPKLIVGKFNTSVRLLGRTNEIFPLGIELNYGYQFLNLKNVGMNRENFNFETSIKGITLIYPGDEGHVFLNFSNYKNANNSYYEISLGIHVIYNKLFSGDESSRFLSSLE